jgi:hypothetical protein
MAERKQHVPTHPDHFDSSGVDIPLSQLCYGPLGNLPKVAAPTDVDACRNAWEASDRAVPFPDYWAGWQAASVLIAQRSELEADRRRYYEYLTNAQHENTVALFQDEIAKRDAKINKLMQPTLKGEAFKKLRLENEELRKKNTELETANKSMRALMRKRFKQHKSIVGMLKGKPL